MLDFSDASLSNRNVIIRADLNVPYDSRGAVTDFARPRACLATIREAHRVQANILLISHCGRPDPAYTSGGGLISGHSRADLAIFDKIFAQIARFFSSELDVNVNYLENILDCQWAESHNTIWLGNNTRLFAGETRGDMNLAKNITRNCDYIIFDAFATSHRNHSSTAGILSQGIPVVAGYLLAAELAAITKLKARAGQGNTWAIIGGSKVSTKIGLLNELIPLTDNVFVGGAMANTFLAANGVSIGKSKFEPEALELARDIQRHASASQTKIHLPRDFLCAPSLDGAPISHTKASIPNDHAIFDIGSETTTWLANQLQHATTIFSNGPMGVFEHPSWLQGTAQTFSAIAQSPGWSLLGGGDTLSALASSGFRHGQFNHVSTGGGALLAALGSSGYACQEFFFKP